MSIKKGALSVALSLSLVGVGAIAVNASASDQVPSESTGVSESFKISPEQEALHEKSNPPTVSFNSNEDILGSSNKPAEVQNVTLNGGFSEQVKITPEQEALHLASNPPTVSFEASDNLKKSLSPDGIITPMYYTGYTIKKLEVGHYIESISQIYLSASKTVNLTLVQYPYSGSGTTHLYYKLTRQGEGTDTSEIGVKGNYSDSNVTISFPSVAKGWYKIQASNYSRDNGPTAEGNGYTNDGNQP
ncbi:hypothetical protein [Paenibacillus graminis]|uniref:hypothetical protein n=1 Tax=Paenibacillus graminis TaxID=189425 RepID=UPI002DB89760|nr:hypothetical protein [Paenibacillus graminis]MEC0170855.1 hypothetical protein [Paenibacillus graminis]